MSARLADFEIRSLRRFSRQWWMERLRTFGWVAVITLLIWVYADITQTEEQEVSLSIRVRSAGNMVLLSPADISIRARIRGRRDAIGRLANKSLPFDASKLPGKASKLPAAPLLSRLPEVRKAGVTVLSVYPDAIDVELAPLVGVETAVSLQTSGGEPTEVKIVPQRVRLLVPAPYKNQILRDSFAVLTAGVDVRGKPVGELIQIQNLELRRPEIPGCRLVTETVDVSFKVSQQVVTKKFNVPLAVQSPHTWHSDDTWMLYELEVRGPELTKEITVKGNRLDLEKLQAKDIRACIVLTEDDKRAPGSWITRQVRVLLPQDRDLPVKGLEVTGIPSVEYRLVARAKALPAT